MAFTRVRLSNFRSIRALTVPLAPDADFEVDTTLVIGANAAGKSNFLQAFRFFRDLMADGLEDAIALQGGPEYITNLALGFDRPVIIEFESEAQNRRNFSDNGKTRRVVMHKSSYRVSVRFSSTHPGRKSVTERVTVSCTVHPGTSETLETATWGTVTFRSLNGRISVKEDLPEPFPTVAELFGTWWAETRLVSRDRTGSLAEVAPLFLAPVRVFSQDIGFYDFDVKLAKRSTSIAGKSELDEDGANLARILVRILSSPDDSRRFANLMRELIPSVDTVEVERLLDLSVLLKLSERYLPERYLPAGLVSDGTIHVAAIVIALFFEDKDVVVIEEPERHLHPSLLAKLVELIKDAARDRQVILSTHNPELIRHFGVGPLLLMSRGRDGSTQARRPRTQQRVRVFLKNDLGVDELYVQNLLG